MPFRDLDITFKTDIVDTHELIIDEGFQRTDVQYPDGSWRIIIDLCYGRQEGSLGLAGCGGCSQQDVLIRIEDRIAGPDLDIP